MSLARKKSVVTSIYIYIGFVFGAINTFLFSKYFQPAEFGLTRVLLDLSMLLTSIACLGAPAVLGRFYPYYKGHLSFKKIDILTLAFITGIIGFLLLCVGIYLFEPVIVRKFSGKSPLLIDYFYLVYPFTFFMVMFQIVEIHAWHMQRPVLTNLFKELIFRGLNFLLILAFMLGVMHFFTFITLYSFIYAAMFAGLVMVFIYKKELPLAMPPSRVTRRMWDKMLPYALFMVGGNVITITARTIDGLVISSVQGLEYAAVFAISSYVSSVLEVPQRSVISIAVPILAQAWKDKHISKIADVYRKTSLNLLVISSFLFTLIWLNLDDAFDFLHLDPIYREGKPLILWLGLAKIVELGTGVNSQIIATSPRWRFELQSNMVLLFLAVPLNYLLIKHFGLVGAGIANLISISVFNAIRFVYLWKHFGLQPFDRSNAFAILLPLALYFPVAYGIRFEHPLINMLARSILFTGVFTFAVVRLHVSEDMNQVYHTFLDKVKHMMGRK